DATQPVAAATSNGNGSAAGNGSVEVPVAGADGQVSSPDRGRDAVAATFGSPADLAKKAAKTTKPGVEDRNNKSKKVTADSPRRNT
ncbi:hypothetical protein ACFQ0D_22425, partial [Micromonospora zhanjiangensis]